MAATIAHRPRRGWIQGLLLAFAGFGLLDRIGTLSHDAKKVIPAAEPRTFAGLTQGHNNNPRSDRLSYEGVSMPRCQRLQAVCLCLGLGLLLSACDPKPTTTTATGAAGAPSSGASPTGIKPADSGDKVDTTATHKGPSEGGAAVGGMSGQGSSAAGGTPAPSGGDGTAPK